MLYLQKNEIAKDIQKIIKESVSHKNIQKTGNEALCALEKHVDEPIKDFCRTHYEVVDFFVLTFKIKKHLPNTIIDYIYTFLANDVLDPVSLKDIIESIATRSNLNDHEKMKILQMSFYFIRYDEFSGKLSINLFKYICSLIDDQNKQIQSTAKPIAIQLIDCIFNRVSLVGGKSSCDDGVKGICNSDVAEDSGLENINTAEVKLSKSSELPSRSFFDKDMYIDDCVMFLEHIFKMDNLSKNMTVFQADMIIVISQKNDIFSEQKICDFYVNHVFKFVAKKIKDGSKGEKEKYFEFLKNICNNNYSRFTSEIDLVMKELEGTFLSSSGEDIICACDFINSLSEEIFFKYFQRFEIILFTILENINMSINNDKIFETIKRISDFMYHNAENSFNRYSQRLFVILKNSKDITFYSLLDKVLLYCLERENKDLFQQYVQVLFDKKMNKYVLELCIEHKQYMQDSWEIIFENSKDDINIIIENTGKFNNEEIFFLVKSLSSFTVHTEKWNITEILSFYKSTYEGILHILIDQNNIKILEIYISSLHSLINTTEDKNRDIAVLNLFCEMILHYVQSIETPNAEVEKIIIKMLRKMLSMNVTLFGNSILEHLYFLLRIFVPRSSWDEIFQIVEMSSISCLHSHLYKVIRIIIDEYLSYLKNDHFCILLSCIEDMCSSSDEGLSMKSIFVLHEVGECLLSKKLVESLSFDVWCSYLNTLFVFFTDQRFQIRDASIRFTFQFINSDIENLSDSEWSYILNHIFLPLLDLEINSIDKIFEDQKYTNTLLLCLEEFSQVQKTRYDDVKLIEKHLEMINIILFYKNIGNHLKMIDQSINLLKNYVYLNVRLDSYEHSSDSKNLVDIYTNDYNEMCKGKHKKSRPESVIHKKRSGKKIHFGGQNNVKAEVTDKLFNFYLNLFNHVTLDDEYPQFISSQLLDSFKYFSIDSICKNISVFERLLQSKNSVAQNKILEILFGTKKNEINANEVLSFFINFNTSDEQLLSSIFNRCSILLGESKNNEFFCKYINRIATEALSNNGMWETCIEYLINSSKAIRTKDDFNNYLKISEKILQYTCLSTDSEIYKVINQEVVFNKEDNIKKTTEYRHKERILLKFLINYNNTLKMLSVNDALDLTNNEILEGYKVISNITVIEEESYRENISIKCYNILFQEINLVYELLVDILLKVIRKYNDEERINNMLFSSIKQREIYVIFELMIAHKNKDLINRLKRDIINCLKSKDYQLIEYVRKSMELIFDE